MQNVAKPQLLHELKVTYDQARGLETRSVRKKLRAEGTLYQYNWLQQVQEQIDKGVKNEDNTPNT